MPRLYGALSFDKASALMQALTKYRGLSTCPVEENPADIPDRKCGRFNERVLYALLHCERYARARKQSGEVAGE